MGAGGEQRWVPAGRAGRLSTDALPNTCTCTWRQVEMDDGSGFRHVARSDERQCTVEGLRSGILYK